MDWGMLWLLREICQPSHTELIKVIAELCNCGRIHPMFLLFKWSYAHAVPLFSPQKNRHEDCVYMSYCGNFSEVYLKLSSLGKQHSETITTSTHLQRCVAETIFLSKISLVSRASPIETNSFAKQV